MRKKKKVTPWWLTRGTELCEHCHELYHYHVQHRCADCDGALCPSCVTVVHATRSSYCVECVPSAESGSNRRHEGKARS
jgi:hypothetical protein